jgi:hypothetical protein
MGPTRSASGASFGPSRSGATRATRISPPTGTAQARNMAKPPPSGMGASWPLCPPGRSTNPTRGAMRRAAAVRTTESRKGTPNASRPAMRYVMGHGSP